MFYNHSSEVKKKSFLKVAEKYANDSLNPGKRGTNQLNSMSNRVEERPQAPADEDFQLVLSCRKGEIEAFEVLVEKYQKKMVNLAYRMIGDYAEACEVVQDGFLSAYRSLKKFRGEARFSTWLYRIVINLSKNRMKQIQTRGAREVPSIDARGDAEEGPLRMDPPDPGPSTLERMEKKEVDARVQGCINGLDSEYREVLVLRDIQGFSYEEIRDILKVPEGTVKSRLFRARDALKGCLKKVLGDL
jgi:RNA polymerase sigma-70 factor (ECF subfamily)